MRGHFFAEHGGVSDTDWVRVTLTAGTRYRFTLTLHGATATAGATIVGVYNSSGTKVADGATAPLTSTVAQSWFTPSANGDYYVAVAYVHRRSGNLSLLDDDWNPWVPTPDYTLSAASD